MKALEHVTDEELIERIKECELVVNELEGSVIYSILKKDAIRNVTHIDANWHKISKEESDKLEELRILKLAYQHLLDLKMKYAEELKIAQDEFTERQLPEEITRKDYDNDSNIDGKQKGDFDNA